MFQKNNWEGGTGGRIIGMIDVALACEELLSIAEGGGGSGLSVLRTPKT